MLKLIDHLCTSLQTYCRSRVILLLLLLLFNYGDVFSFSGIVIPLTTPLFSEPSKMAPISMYVREGTKIYIHSKHKGYGPGDVIYEDQKVLGQDNDDKSEFYLTLDKTGQDAYVLKDHVKLIYEDSREFEKNIEMVPRDNMDYRLSEPLSPIYPFFEKNLYKANLSLDVGPARKLKYDYSLITNSERYLPSMGFSLNYTKTVNADKENRLFFGGILQYNYNGAEFIFPNNINSFEESYLMGIGPYLLYDFYRSEKSIFSIEGGIILNMVYTLIYNKDHQQNEILIDQTYDGFSITPELRMTYQQKVSFVDNLKYFAGIKLQTNLPYTLKSKTEDISISTGGTFAILFGLQFVQSK